ncbi:hypothetical protein ACMD2_26039 [Ananas comosus]|uniref:Uncharacterized protein n=1 Tax=Ananas comosus TaxID=4615 RepID=A0A199VGQ4_ANACO|nr:hypothetical protein ACMD2_26039 [Ananas comosus]
MLRSAVLTRGGSPEAPDGWNSESTKLNTPDYNYGSSSHQDPPPPASPSASSSTSAAAPAAASVAALRRPPSSCKVQELDNAADD